MQNDDKCILFEFEEKIKNLTPIQPNQELESQYIRIIENKSKKFLPLALVKFFPNNHTNSKLEKLQNLLMEKENAILKLLNDLDA